MKPAKEESFIQAVKFRIRVPEVVALTGYDRTPEQAGMKLRRKPVRPTWKPLYGDHQYSVSQVRRLKALAPAELARWKR